ncbi:inositol monophosphatase [Nonomuraea sp. NPDC049152]|uniref:inositol monophosphatase family protein n=1 Tax=Nonomuraea sp. NPDC049152 TaxID=3154350 RepID=UPI0033F99DA9
MVIMQVDKVTEILRETAQAIILPRYRALALGDVMEKSPGEVVTTADREAEDLITRRLRGVLDAPVVGEEAVAANPRLIDALSAAATVWLVDPLDGTANFVAGSPDYAVMAALVRNGHTVASWIVRPVCDRAYVAEHGAGAWRDGVRVSRAPASDDPARLRGAVLTRFLTPAARTRVEGVASRFAALEPGAQCSGVDYPRLVDGELDFVAFRRILPWDHAPGAFLLTEAGGVVRHFDHTTYRPTDTQPGLLTAAGASCWQAVRSVLHL